MHEFFDSIADASLVGSARLTMLMLNGLGYAQGAVAAKYCMHSEHQCDNTNSEAFSEARSKR